MVDAPTIRVPGAQAQAAPLPTRSLRPPPEAFGASVAGQALGDLGRVVSAHGEEAFKYESTVQALNNKQASDAAAVDVSGQMNKFLEDYQADNRGMKAYDNSPAAFDQLEAIRAQGENGLSPLALTEYQSRSRASLQYAQSAVRTFANTQRYGSLVETNKAITATAVGQAVASSDDAVLNNSLATIGQTNAHDAQIQGWSPETANYELHKAVGTIFVGKIKVAADAGNYPEAQQIYAAHKDDMTAEQVVAVAGVLKAGLESYTANSDRQSWGKGEVVGGTVPTPTSEAVFNSILGEESGGRDNVGQSLKGAMGPAQITPGTFAQYARPGEHIDNPKDNRAVGARIIDDYMLRYNGDAARVAVAYFSGPGNVSPAGSALPYRKDTSDGNERVSQYVDHVVGRTGRAPSTPVGPPQIDHYTDPSTFMADTRVAAQRYVDDQYANNPRQATLSYNAIVAGAQQDADVLSERQKGAYVQALSLVESNNLQDQASIPPSLWASLPPQYKVAIDRDLKANANELTPQRQLNMMELEGQRAAAVSGQSDAFLNTDIAGADIPRNSKTAYMKAQADLKNKKAKATNEDTVVSKVLRTVDGRATLDALGLRLSGAVDADNAPYFQFVGTLQSNVEQWMAANPNKAMATKDVQGVLSATAGLVGQRAAVKDKTFGTTLGIFGGSAEVRGTPTFAVPTDDRARILAKRPDLANNESAIALAYHNALAREKSSAP